MIEPFDIDISLFLWLNGDGGQALDAVMYWVSGRLSWAFLYALLLWGAWKRLGWKNLLWFILAIAIAVALSDQGANLAKTYLPKLRPSHYEAIQNSIHTDIYGYRGGLYGTISAHAACTTALMVLCGMLFKRWWVWISLGVWVALVSYSRIYLGVHYPLDILLGVALGTLCGVITMKIFNKFVLRQK